MAAKGIERLPDLIKIAGQAPQELLPDMVRSVLSGFIRAIAAVNGGDRPHGKAASGLASNERAKPAAGGHPRRRAHRRNRVCRACSRCNAVQKRPPSRRLAWARAPADSTGGKTRLSRISKTGDGYLRRLLVLGATSLLRHLQNKSTPLALWAQALLARRPKRLVIVAIANKLARIAWAVIAKSEPPTSPNRVRSCRRERQALRFVHERGSPALSYRAPGMS